MAAAASWAGTSTDPMAVNCQALRMVPASRAIRRQIKVATEPVSSRPGPMAVDRLFTAQDSAEPTASWTRPAQG